jgi:deoxyribodipyrimidine photo-lyase
MIQEERIAYLSQKPFRKGRYVLYWIQTAPRVTCNHAYQYAVRMADRLSIPLLACFNLVPGYPEATRPQYRFLIEGLLTLSRTLEEQGVRLVIITGEPGAAPLALGNDAALVVTDKGYLRFQNCWKEQVAAELDCSLVQVETNVVVPFSVASPKEEWSAATFRKKIAPQIDRFLVAVEENKPSRSSLKLDTGSAREETDESLLAGIFNENSVKPGSTQPDPLPWTGGEFWAKYRLNRFIQENLDRYPADRNNPATGVLSCMSPYLHFGQISPLFIAKKIVGSGSPSAGIYLEELIVRRELSVNFVSYNPHYDEFSGLPDWAKKTLNQHSTDHRDYLYRYSEFESALTHDPYWNAAQLEMILTGKMHGYMRMYWGKKILEWSETPQEAFRTAIALNNKYELDGRDPNGYAGVAWCFGKHDRPWKERSVFGTIRYMTAAGLNRKFDVSWYVSHVEALRNENKI